MAANTTSFTTIGAVGEGSAREVQALLQRGLVGVGYDFVGVNGAAGRDEQPSRTVQLESGQPLGRWSGRCRAEQRRRMICTAECTCIQEEHAPAVRRSRNDLHAVAAEHNWRRYEVAVAVVEPIGRLERFGIQRDDRVCKTAGADGSAANCHEDLAVAGEGEIAYRASAIGRP